jgi:hypothetical protein
MSEGRAVAGAAQADAESESDAGPTRWLDQPAHSADRELDTWLPGLTRHQQADKWLIAEAAHDRGPRGDIAARILRRKFELLDASELLAAEESCRELVRLEGQTATRPAVLAALNYLLQHPDERPAADTEPDARATEPVAAGNAAAGGQVPPTAAADGGSGPSTCPDCGSEMRPDEVQGESFWWCVNCAEGYAREVSA